MAKLVTKTYGEALFKIAVEENQLDVLEQEAREVLAVFGENTDLLKLLNHPKISREEKIKVVETVFKGNVSDTITGLLVIIVEKGRYDELEGIFQYFLSEVMEYNNIGVAYITSASELSKKQKDKVESRLMQVTKYVKFVMHFAVDESLIGGMVVRIGDRVVDSSIRTKLSTMAGELKKIQLQ